jgi:hypothetical protein
MSYSIYYDRAFIRVGDKFVPMVNSGSNNCFQFNGRREVPEKNWGVLNWKRSGRVMFSRDEILEIARDYDMYNCESGMLFKSRYRVFGPGEFGRFVINGMKSACTVEEYRSFGNELYVLDYVTSGPRDWVKYPFTTTEELLSVLNRLGSANEINIRLNNNREVYRPVNHRPRGPGLRAGDLTEYYVLGGRGVTKEIKGLIVYLVKLRPHGISYHIDSRSGFLKVFRTGRDAERYISRYENRLKQFAAFKPELIAKHRMPEQ